MRFTLFFLLILGTASSSFAQTERGNVIRSSKIFQKKTQETNTTETVDPESFKQEVDFRFEEEPKLRFQNNFEPKEVKRDLPSNLPGSEAASGVEIEILPVKPLNQTIHEDTSSIDEGELMVVEIEEMVRFPGSDEMVEVASYFSIWDTRYVNPYGIDPKTFDETIPIKLYDINRGRYWAPPLDYTPITSHFGYRWKRWHKGTDIDLETGDPVYAVFDGIVRISGVQGAFGRCIVIRHYNGLETVYAHLSQLHLSENTPVKAGDLIGRGGNTGRSTGSHLHFEMRYEGNPFDPENVFRFSRDKTDIKMQEFLMTARLYDYLRGKSSRVYLDEVDESIRPSEAIAEGDAELEDEFEEEIPDEVVQIVWYRVRPGDTLYKIAKSYGTTVSEISRLNKISSYKKLYVGTRLRVK
jgi:hypothetical protein